MATIGSFGDVLFEVSTEKTLTFYDLEKKAMPSGKSMIFKATRLN